VPSPTGQTYAEGRLALTIFLSGHDALERPAFRSDRLSAFFEAGSGGIGGAAVSSLVLPDHVGTTQQGARPRRRALSAGTVQNKRT